MHMIEQERKEIRRILWHDSRRHFFTDEAEMIAYTIMWFEHLEKLEWYNGLFLVSGWFVCWKKLQVIVEKLVHNVLMKYLFYLILFGWLSFSVVIYKHSEAIDLQGLRKTRYFRNCSPAEYDSP